jgi:sugar phosphate isomerase/epimerase
LRPHGRVSLSAVSSWSWSLEQDIDFWAELGVGLVGLSAAKLRAAGLDEGVRRVRESGIAISSLLGPGPFDLGSPGRWASQRAQLEELVEAARELRAGCLVVTTGAPGRLSWEEAADALEEAIGPVLEHAHHGGVRIALEHTNSLRADLSFLHSLRDAVELARRLGTGVCMEANACWLERGLARTISEGAGTFCLVQVSDFVVGTRDTPNRAVPGDGDIPLERIVSQALEAGYEGPFDLELIGPRIEQEGYRSAIVRGLEWLGGTLASLGVRGR